MQRPRSNPAGRAPQAAATVLLLLAAWLLPGLHGLWCGHGHAAGGFEVAGALAALGEAREPGAGAHRHGCPSDEEALEVAGEPRSRSAAQPRGRSGGEQVESAPRRPVGCVLELLAPSPGTDPGTDAPPVVRRPAPLAASPATGAAPRALVRHLLAPKNSPPAEGRRRQVGS